MSARSPFPYAVTAKQLVFLIGKVAKLPQGTSWFTDANVGYVSSRRTERTRFEAISCRGKDFICGKESINLAYAGAEIH